MATKAKAPADPVIELVDQMRIANAAIKAAQAAQKRSRRLKVDHEMARTMREIEKQITDVTVRALVNS